MRHTYETNSKKALKDYLKNHSDKHFTAEEIIAGLSSGGSKASRSTIYRQISCLLKSGDIRRFETHDKKNFVYQYAGRHVDCDMHYHLKCTECGKLIHMECEKMNEIKNHIFMEHGFTIGGTAVINGICHDCFEKNDLTLEEKID